MSSGRFASDFLSAREARQALVAQALQKGRRATIFLSLNIPGENKAPAGSQALFSSMCVEVTAVFTGSTLLERASDVLGPYALWALDDDPQAVKARCVRLEASSPAARLVDLDVYSAQGVQIDRKSLFLPGRGCLVCEEPAVDCIRARRHSFDQVIGKVDELLTPYRA